MKNNDSCPLENIRRRTGLNQDQFAHECNISRSTYQSYVAGRTETRLTPNQLVKIARLAKLSFREVMQLMGVDCSDIPFDYPPNFSEG